MAQQPAPRPIPIVWYLDATDLVKRGCTPVCYKLLVDAVAEWEADGNRTLDDLREVINDILEKKCP
jgi:hypothetical protein